MYQDNQNQDQAKRGINEFMQAVIDGDKEALRVVKENSWEFMQAVMGETQALSAIVDSVWGYESPTEDEEDKDAPRFPKDEAETRFNEFMSAVIDGDKEALQIIADHAWEYLSAVIFGDTQELSAIVGGGCTPPTTEDEAPAPRFPNSLKLWREAHPNAFVFEDEDDVWMSTISPTEKDEVIPHCTIPMPYPTGNEDLDDEDLDEDFSIGWRYYPAPENPDAWIAVAPSRRALRAYIREGRILRNNPKVIRVSYRR